MGKAFKLERLAMNVGRGEDQTKRARESGAALNPVRPRQFRVRCTTLQTEKKAKVGWEGRRVWRRLAA